MGEVKKCPTCGTENSPSEPFCTNCNAMIAGVSISEAGTSAPPASTPPTADALPVSEPGIPCPDQNCGFMNSLGSTSCILCNTTLIPKDKPIAAVDKAKVDNKTTEPPEVKEEINTNPITPYRTGGREFTSLHDIALYYAGNWDEGMEQIDDNYLLRWADMNSPAHIAADDFEFLKKLSRSRSRGHEIRLMQFIARYAPEIPPIWKGTPLSIDNLVALLAKAVDGDSSMREQALEILDRDVISAVLYAREDKDMVWCNSSIEMAYKSFEEAVGYAQSVGRFTHLIPTDRSIIRPALALAAISSKYVSSVRRQVKLQAGISARFCPWFATLGSIDNANIGRLIIMLHVTSEASLIGQRHLKTVGVKISKSVMKIALICVVIYLGFRGTSSWLQHKKNPVNNNKQITTKAVMTDNKGKAHPTLKNDTKNVEAANLKKKLGYPIFEKNNFAVYKEFALDLRTGLLWTRNTDINNNGKDIVYRNNYSWKKASEIASKCKIGGFSDWRLPTEYEIMSICKDNVYYKAYLDNDKATRTDHFSYRFDNPYNKFLKDIGFKYITELNNYIIKDLNKKKKAIARNFEGGGLIYDPQREIYQSHIWLVRGTPQYPVSAEKRFTTKVKKIFGLSPK